MCHIIVVFDIETTGLDKKNDQIIQFSAIKVDTHTHKIIDKINEYIQPLGEYSISLGAYLKHGIDVDFLKDKPYFKDIAEKIVEFFGNNDTAILTYNGISFDLPFLINELNKYGYDLDIINRPVFDSFLEEKRRSGNTLEKIYEKYNGKSMEDSGLKAHDAMSDIKATYSIFANQQKIQKFKSEHLYGEDGVISDQEFLGNVVPCFNIGKYKGISVEFISKVDQNYLKWAISDSSNFMKTTKNFLKKYII